MKQLTLILLLLTATYISAQTKDTPNLKMTKQLLLEKGFSNIYKGSEIETVSSFKVKVINYRTVYVKGNSFNNDAKAVISRAKVGDIILFFDIKHSKGGKSKPIAIEVI